MLHSHLPPFSSPLPFRVADDDDASVTRSNEILLSIFARAGLRVVRNDVQHNFPRGLFEVRMYALQ